MEQKMRMGREWWQNTLEQNFHFTYLFETGNTRRWTLMQYLRICAKVSMQLIYIRSLLEGNLKLRQDILTCKKTLQRFRLSLLVFTPTFHKLKSNCSEFFMVLYSNPLFHWEKFQCWWSTHTAYRVVNVTVLKIFQFHCIPLINHEVDCDNWAMETIDLWPVSIT